MKKLSLENQHALAVLRDDEPEIIHDLANTAMRASCEWNACITEYRTHRARAHGETLAKSVDPLAKHAARKAQKG